jgi:hypothetical protein
MKGFLVLSLLFVFLFSASAFTDLENGLAAAYRGDFSIALKEWKPLAEQGDAYAQYNMGLIYAHGLGVIEDYVRALMWLNIAASRGDNDAAKAREFITKKLTSSQIAEAQKLARECVAKNYKGC